MKKRMKGREFDKCGLLYGNTASSFTAWIGLVYIPSYSPQRFTWARSRLHNLFLSRSTLSVIWFVKPGRSMNLLLFRALNSRLLYEKNSPRDQKGTTTVTERVLIQGVSQTRRVLSMMFKHFIEFVSSKEHITWKWCLLHHYNFGKQGMVRLLLSQYLMMGFKKCKVVWWIM